VALYPVVGGFRVHGIGLYGISSIIYMTVDLEHPLLFLNTKPPPDSGGGGRVGVVALLSYAKLPPATATPQPRNPAAALGPTAHQFPWCSDEAELVGPF
jgi:hypothetical protein